MTDALDDIRQRLDALESRLTRLESRGGAALPPRPTYGAPPVPARKRGAGVGVGRALVIAVGALVVLVGFSFSVELAAIGTVIALLGVFVRGPRAVPAAATLTPPTLGGEPVAAPASREGTELEVGRKLLPVVGVGLLFLGVALLLSYVFRFIGPEGKVLLSSLASAALFGVAFFTRRRFELFANVVFAGAWGVAYLTTYATHFFQATKLIASPGLALFLLLIVVAALLAVAIATGSKWMVAYGLALGFLTAVLSPLSLFAVGTTVFLFAVAVVLVWALPWDELLLPATAAAALSYLYWFADVGGRYPAQGGGLLEKQFASLLAVVLLWALAAAGVAVRRGASPRVGAHDATTAILLTSFLAASFGLGAVRELAGEAARAASAVYLAVLAGLHAGWGALLPAAARRGGTIAAAAVLATLFATAAIGLAFPAGSAGVSLAWAAFGVLCVTGAALFGRAPLAALGALPFAASILRYFTSDLDATDLVAGALPVRLVVGLLLALLLGGTALGTRRISAATGAVGVHYPGALLAGALAILFAVAHKEFPGAAPTVLWGILGLGVIVGGFFGRWTDARIAGLAALAAAVFRVFVHDLAGLEPIARVVAFIVLGMIFLLIGYGYNRNREQIARFLSE